MRFLKTDNELLLKKILNINVDLKNTINNCLLQGINRGFIQINSKECLNNCILSGECYNCTFKISASLENCLYQPLRGEDYKSGGSKAAIQCPSCGLGNYVTGICCGKMSMLKEKL